ncbi:MAG: heavy metal-binding domain-containing protein [Hespellia sp.]|nr:heavy metal-binding domain-containing protein [Hespellia sp.]
MKCSNCGNELTEDMFVGGLCFNCGHDVSETVALAEKEKALADEEQERLNKKKAMEEAREKQERIEQLRADQAERTSHHRLTTGFTFEDCKIDKYLGLVSGEVVIGSGYLSDIAASISDFLGVEATEYSDKLKCAKKAALNDMISESVELGGNAIIGISYEYLTFSGNMIGVSVNGTSVSITEK